MKSGQRRAFLKTEYLGEFKILEFKILEFKIEKKFTSQ
jgi:hypothetical protein